MTLKRFGIEGLHWGGGMNVVLFCVQSTRNNTTFIQVKSLMNEKTDIIFTLVEKMLQTEMTDHKE